MATCAVTNYNNVVEAQSDSDDEDKLHIVEEEPDGDSPPPEDHAAVLNQNGTEPCQEPWDGVKEECGSEEEDDEEEEAIKDALVGEIRQADTAVIYPEAPEDQQKSMPKRGVPDENGTLDDLSQLRTCPYCSRGYKRYTSLKEHIKLRHEKSEDNFSCSQCSYTFAYRTQLERHMTQHKTQHKDPVQRHASQTTTTTGGNRKFKCTECSKAFKYKHHLKEHLRIHSGEKPYECPNCKKRFSHSGSYSSHISSKKCVGTVPINGIKAPQAPNPQTQPSGPAAAAPARGLPRGEKMDGKPLQEQRPLNQIKSEPVEYEYKTVALAPNGSAGANGTVFSGGVALAQGPTMQQGLVQAVVLPTVGLMSPISINLSDLQNVLKVAMDGNVLRQVLGSANGLVTSKQGLAGQTGQQVISAISLPGFVDQDGTTKIIINYSLEPSLTQQPQLVKKEPPLGPAATLAPAAPKAPEKLPQDLSIVKTEPPDPETQPESEREMESKEAQSEAERSEEAATPEAVPGKASCLLCNDCPGGSDAQHMMLHCESTNGEGGDDSPLDTSVANLLAEAGITTGQPPPENMLSLLKAYVTVNTQPTSEELAKISDSVSLPVDVVKNWFEKMRSGQVTVGPPGSSSLPLPTEPSTETQAAQEKSGGEPEEPHASVQTQETSSSQSPNRLTSPSLTASSPSPLNLSSSSGLVIVKAEGDLEGEAQDLPLDLSLPKQPQSEPHVPPIPQEQPLNLSCLKKETLHLQTQGSTNTIYVSTSPKTATSSPVNIMTSQLPTLVAITNSGSGVSCLRAISTGPNKRTILIPQLTYTYTTTTAGVPGGSDGAQKTVILNGCQQEEKGDTSSESVSAVEEQDDSDSTPPPKKTRRLESGRYACDLCDKIFQKSSSLLRHKYEHTGKRPHECGICNKAFKHKHHLIEHARLHSGEKPYRCDKCGKRFSHSGSYSQHMNHRYSYCKKEPQGARSAGRRLGMSPQTEDLQSDSRPASPPSQLDSDERESEEELEEEGEDEGMAAMSMDDIRVVQVGEDDEESEIYEVEEFGEERMEEDGEMSREEEPRQEEEEVGVCTEEEAQQGEETGGSIEEAQQENEEEGGSREGEMLQEEENYGNKEKEKQQKGEEGSREEEAKQEEESVQEQVCEEEKEDTREEEDHLKVGELMEWSKEECVQGEELGEEEVLEVLVMEGVEEEEDEEEKGLAQKETVATEDATETEDIEVHGDQKDQLVENRQTEPDDDNQDGE